ncbi:NlpC-P60 family protein [Pseudoxanthomonas kalamensis DSM 18571]|uniref:C40 family peptidase n=1 Tax=Pseudoxanthomonas kalamensis TaxID=289483 RepID=UPI001390AB8E|nr:SH3 domain-containing protein [Pseudoxanthomonas kalamensis]KAF1712602.1 NlpC-P60 family protein [Pseudoxanthomonas kalamensis DSM 18571]
MNPAPMLALLLALAPGTVALAREALSPDTGLLGIRIAQLEPGYWQSRLAHPDRPVMDTAAIAAQNARLYALDPTMHRLAELPATLPGEQVRAWISKLSAPPTRTLYDAQGKQIDDAALDNLQQSLQLAAIPASVAPRFGLIMRRGDLRAFPTRLRTFSTIGDTDIDRFQESALFPGTTVAVVHESLDGQWWFVVGPNYAAWIEKQYVALGERTEVLDYADQGPSLVVTGADVLTTFTPEEPRVSSLRLDMGLRLPLLTDWPQDRAVNGQHPYASYVVQLPVRDANGGLQLVPALVPRSADVREGYLPLTPSNLIAQSFKFLGERYGWGHSYGTRDCSGFVSEIYRSMGVELPRNTSAQAVSPALNRIAFDPADSLQTRLAVVRDTRPGDLIYIPGHVMMVIGHQDGRTWVIHDTSGTSYRDASGQRVSAHLNGVSVTPLEPLLFNGDTSYVERITSIQRIRP